MSRSTHVHPELAAVAGWAIFPFETRASESLGADWTGAGVVLCSGVAMAV